MIVAFMFQVFGFALVALFLIVLLRPMRPEWALLLSVSAGVILLLFLAGQFSTLLALLQEISLRANVNLEYGVILFRVIGVAYLAQFCAEIARDAGESAIASKVELAGKVFILLLATPIVTGILEVLTRMLEVPH